MKCFLWLPEEIILLLFCGLILHELQQFSNNEPTLHSMINPIGYNNIIILYK